MIKKTIAIIGLTLMFAFSAVSYAQEENEDFLHSKNCVGSRWTDEFGNSISIDEKFGPGSQAVTRCLGKTRRARVLYQINTLYKDASDPSKGPYAVGNIKNHIVDFETTHGMSSDDYEIVVVVHSSGWKLVLNNSTNPYLGDMTSLVNTPSVKVLFCQNTASKKGVKLVDMIPGIGFTTSGVSAIADLQNEGYRYVQP